MKTYITQSFPKECHWLHHTKMSLCQGIKTKLADQLMLPLYKLPFTCDE